MNIDEIKEQLPDYKFPLILIKDDPLKMVPTCNGVICASGTATLLVGLLRVPLIIMYKMNGFSAWFAKTFVTATKYFGLINIVMEKMVAPEFFQEKANPNTLFENIDKIMYDDAYRENMISDLTETKAKLGDKGATQRVVRILEEYL